MLLYAAQDMIGLLGCKHTLPAHIQFHTHHYPRVLLRRAALTLFIPLSVLILGIVPAQVQDLVPGLGELHEVCTGPLLMPVETPPE